ncbi:MAG: sulfite exporter TauE/SafE family protein [Clostridia bacterium]|nr:sulfite exporter TauE/SafE family protein [Clostridia bacterium]
MIIFYFALIVLAASTLGAMAGVGGGVIIRPAIDAFGYYGDASVPNLISSFCVLAVAVTSVTRHAVKKTKFNTSASVLLGIGAAAGGIAGKIVFRLIKERSDRRVLTLVQSVILILLIAFVILYVLALKRRFRFEIKNRAATLAVGLALGFISALLGIGGGPINVAVLCLFFGMDMKSASINSLLIIIFAQISNLLTSLATGELMSADMNWLHTAILVAVAVGGSLTGTFLNRKLSEKTISGFYIFTMFVIIGINLYNIASCVG